MSVASGYLLCGTPRSGSTLLCGLLESTGVLGRPRSWFREPDEAAIARELGVPVSSGQPADVRQYARAVDEAARTPNGVLAARIMWGSLEHLLACLDPAGGADDFEVLQEAFGPLVVVHLRRVDIIDQAVSWCRAEQTGYWQHGDTVRAEPTLDLDQLLGLVTTIRDHEAAWPNWFRRNGIPPVEATYEGVGDDPAGTVRRIAAHSVSRSLTPGDHDRTPHARPTT